MTEWFAFVCTVERMENGAVAYPVGSVYSYSAQTVPPERLRAAGLKAVSIGQYGSEGPPLGAKVWDSATETLVDRPAPGPSEEQTLLEKGTWSEADKEAALRVLLRRLR